MRSELVIRLDYGRIVPWVRRIDDSQVAIAGPDGLCFRTPVELHGEDLTSVSEFTLQLGERVPFVLTWYPSHRPPPDAIDPEQALADAEDFWHEWAGRCRHDTDYHEPIHHAARPQGADVCADRRHRGRADDVAAGGDRRQSQLGLPLLLAPRRDADAARDAADGLPRRGRGVAPVVDAGDRGDPGELQIMYGLAGERRLDERELEWLPGYEGSRPVRVGNAASAQLQLDVYGEVAEALYQTRAHGAPPDDNVWSLSRFLLEWLEDNWQRPDAGIWRCGARTATSHSKVMAWVAFDRAVRSHDVFGRHGPVERWRSLRDQVRAEILDRAWSEKKQSFTQSYDSDELDASVLLMAAVGFLPATDERFVSTVDAIRRELSVDGLLQRYRPAADGSVDGLREGEGVFLPCSFWLADALALQGELDEARSLRAAPRPANDVGLLSEEYDPVAGRQLGNFPQALSHLSLVNTALILSEQGSLRRREQVAPR